jgi:hypothetical protein
MSQMKSFKHEFFHFEKFLSSKSTFSLTIIGIILAFVFAFMEITYIPLDFGIIAIPPYKLSLSFVVVLFISMKTKNFASTILVTLSSFIGLIPYNDSSFTNINIALNEVYVAVLLTTMIILAYHARSVKKIHSWNTRIFLFCLIFSIWAFQLGFVIREYSQGFWRIPIPVGIGGDLDFYNHELIPLQDVIVLTFALIFAITVFIKYRGDLNYDRGQIKRSKIFGYILLLLSQVISLATMIFFVVRMSHDQAKVVVGDSTRLVNSLQPLRDLFLKSATYPVVVSPANVFLFAIITTLFTSTGIIMIMTGKKGGTMAAVNGGDEIVLLAAPIFTLLFIIIASYQIQTFFYPDGYVIANELIIIYFTVIWSFVTLSQIIAYIFLKIFAAFTKK